jgi:hypothetical protein
MKNATQPVRPEEDENGKLNETEERRDGARNLKKLFYLVINHFQFRQSNQSDYFYKSNETKHSKESIR